MIFLPPLLGVPRELGITDGSLKPLSMQTASSALPKCSAPGTGSRSGPKDGGAHTGHSGLLARGGQTRPCAAAVYLLVPGP